MIGDACGIAMCIVFCVFSKKCVVILVYIHPSFVCIQLIELRPRPRLGMATAQRRAQNRTAWKTLVETATLLTSSG